MSVASVQPVINMPLLSRIKTYLYSRALHKFQGTNLNKAPADHFSAIKDVGIIFDAAEARSRDIVTEYQEFLKTKQIESRALGFFNSKIEGVNFKFDFFDTTQLTFSYLPKSEAVDRFIHTPFDVLINLDTSLHKPLTYIAAASQAVFKIGPSNGDHRHYDLMIHIKDGDLNKYIQEIRKTFNKIQG